MRRIYRLTLLAEVISVLQPHDANDLPCIRMAINETADFWRKRGYAVRDFAQDRLVADVQRKLRSR